MITPAAISRKKCLSQEGLCVDFHKKELDKRKNGNKHPMTILD